jgi:hypothetical protein
MSIYILGRFKVLIQKKRWLLLAQSSVTLERCKSDIVANEINSIESFF